jgi:hypothetical protein
VSLFDAIASRAGTTLGGLAIATARQRLPAGLGLAVNAGVNAAGRVLQGDLGGAVGAILDSGILLQHFPHLSGLASSMAFNLTPNRLFGGITPLEARKIFDQSRGEECATKKLFLIEIAGFNGAIDAGEVKFNLFATDVSYAPYTITGDTQKVGSATANLVTGSEPVELSITTLDDIAGTLKKWFERRASLTVHPDGTVGLPAEYLIKIRIVHSFVTSETAAGGHGVAGYYRPANLQLGLSRRDDALEELQMTFSQFDTFVPVV